MRKLHILLSFSISFLAACSNPNQQKETHVEEIKSIGGNKDKNGCLTAAGQTWSEIRKDCIQIFSEGIRLNPISVDSNQAIISAFVLSNTDSTAYELFLPNSAKTYILNKSSNEIFRYESFAFHKNSGELFRDNKLIYKREN